MPVFKSVSPAGQAKAILESNGKFAENLTGATLVAGTVCAWTTGGTLEAGEADNISANTFAGVVYEDIANGSFGLVVRSGKLPGVLAGLSAVAGQPVFLSATPGQLTLTSPPDGDAVARIGYAEPTDHVTGLGTDLFIEFELISSF
jgi:hypothetical protein